ncbi:hypothetical protein [Stackebrandtia soli]
MTVPAAETAIAVAIAIMSRGVRAFLVVMTRLCGLAIVVSIQRFEGCG